MADEKVIKAAIKLAQAAHKAADKHLPGKLADIVKTHSMIAVGASFVPIPGADVAAAAANIWSMYARINSELSMPFSENIIKSVAGGVATNLGASYAASLVVGGVFKLFPGLGTLAGAAVIAGTVYGLTIASGVIYMHALAHVLNAKRGAEVTEEELRQSTEEVLGDKDLVDSTFREAKAAYRKSKKKK